MKKLIFGLIAAFLMAAGLVTVSGGTPAFADCNATAYNSASCAPTATVKPAGVSSSPATAPVVKKGKSKTIKTSFSSPTAKRGLVIINVFRNGKQVKSVWFRATESGEAVQAKLKGLKAGLYKVTIIVSPRGQHSGKAKSSYYFKVA